MRALVGFGVVRVASARPSSLLESWSCQIYDTLDDVVDDDDDHHHHDDGGGDDDGHRCMDGPVWGLRPHTEVLEGKYPGAPDIHLIDPVLPDFGTISKSVKYPGERYIQLILCI